MKSKMDQISTSVEEIKKTQKESTKPVIAFRATCAKNFPSDWNTSKSENPGTITFLTVALNLGTITAEIRVIAQKWLKKFFALKKF